MRKRSLIGFSDSLLYDITSLFQLSTFFIPYSDLLLSYYDHLVLSFI